MPEGERRVELVASVHQRVEYGRPLRCGHAEVVEARLTFGLDLRIVAEHLEVGVRRLVAGRLLLGALGLALALVETLAFEALLLWRFVRFLFGSL